MSTWIWNNKLRFKQIYPTVELFKELIDTIAEEIPRFDIDKLYNVMTRKYIFDKILHTSKNGFDNDFEKIFNDNIFVWNRVFDLLNENYDDETGKQTVVSETIKDTSNRIKQDNINVNNTGTADQTSFDKPQFGDLEANPSNKVVGATTDAQDSTQDTNEDIVKDVIRDTTNKQQAVNRNERINEYMAVYERFSYNAIAKEFDSLFVNLLL